jgi:hypothetical protein
VEERVSVSGRPLREHHRRLALRDKRLLEGQLACAPVGFTKKK